MTRRCELTGKLPLSGQSRSHAENATKRKFRPNLVNVTLISEVLDRKFKLRITAHAVRSVEHRGGLDAFLAIEKYLLVKQGVFSTTLVRGSLPVTRLPMAWALGQVIDAALPGVATMRLGWIAILVVLLAAIAALSSCVPALNASRIRPARVLQAD